MATAAMGSPQVLHSFGSSFRLQDVQLFHGRMRGLMASQFAPMSTLAALRSWKSTELHHCSFLRMPWPILLLGTRCILWLSEHPF